MPTALRTDEYLTDDIYLEGSFSEVGIAEARIGSHGTPQTHELAIGADTGGPFSGGQTANFPWESDEVYGCELVYDPQADTTEGKRARMTLTVGEESVTWTQEEEGNDPRLNVLAVRLRALKAESSIEVTNIRITPAGAQNGVIEPPTDHVSVAGADGLKSLVILGAELLNGFEMTFSLKMVFEDSGPNKPMQSQLAMQVKMGAWTCGGPKTPESSGCRCRYEAPGEPAAQAPVAKGGNGGGPCEDTISSEPVRYSMGQIISSTTDLVSGGFGNGWGHTRTDNNQFGAAMGGPNGVTRMVAQFPRVFSGPRGAAVAGGAPQIGWFVKAAGEFSPEFYSRNRLSEDTGAQEFRLADTRGNITVFNSAVSGVPANRRGKFKKFLDPAGHVTEVVSVSAAGEPTEIRREGTFKGQTVTESWLYDYEDSGANEGMLREVSFRRRVDAGAWETVRKAEYVYYGEDDPQRGFAGWMGCDMGAPSARTTRAMRQNGSEAPLKTEGEMEGHLVEPGRIEWAGSNGRA